jgi:hypothetical protein
LPPAPEAFDSLRLADHHDARQFAARGALCTLCARYVHDALHDSLIAVSARLVPGWHAHFRAVQAYPAASRTMMEERAAVP